MKKLVLIDGHAIMHRAYHALPKTLTTKAGEPINAVYGFVSMLLRIIQDLEPTYIAVAFDRKEPTFRNKMYEAYQAHRPEMDKELSGQFEKVEMVLSAMNIPSFSKVGYEADDVIGTLADRKQREVDEVDIITGDRDILQLVNGKVRVFLPIKGLSEGKLYNRKDVKKKMGVGPEKIVDYKALVGDPSDNYPGVKGIGPKTAEKLLEGYGSLEGIYKNLGKIDEKIREKLEKYKEDALISQKLAKIVTNVDFDYELGKADDWRVDSKKLLDLFAGFGFRTLTKRVKEVGKKVEEEKQGSLF